MSFILNSDCIESVRKHLNACKVNPHCIMANFLLLIPSSHSFFSFYENQKLVKSDKIIQPKNCKEIMSRCNSDRCSRKSSQ